jgi:antitoxin component YwqK of YwqJK toxin-antitoxin module
MKVAFKIFVVCMQLLILLACGVNKFDKQGNRKGKWKSYWNNQQVQAVGKYKNDWQKGVWRFYDEQGRLIQKQKHYKDRTMDIFYYYPNGSIESTGKAKIKYDEKGNIQYFWYNKWLFYNADGSFKTEKYYLEGQVMEEEQLTK